MRSLLICAFLIVLNPFYAQKTKEETDQGKVTKVYINTDLNFSSSSNDSRSESRAGVGKLGLKFESGFMYGHAAFTVYSQNKEINSGDTAETKLFGTNLLLPQNSSNNISNFNILLGTRSFYKYDNVDDKTPFFHWKRFGGVFNFMVNNTRWVKDSLSTSITINTLNLFVTYNILNLTLTEKDSDGEKISLYMLFGYTGRRLGGDYGLDKTLQKEFINSNKLGFDGTYLGCRLEIGKFYGQMSLTNFSRGDKIKGFSGDQAVISIGIIADLKIAAKYAVKSKE
jgi:hypothetical protein